MIFATVGSSGMSFARLVGALAAIPPEELVVQHGPAAPPPALRAVPYLPFDEVNRLMAEADVIVCHAGVGSVLCALRAGHVPVVVPRLRRHAETVDDHQMELALALGREGRVLPVFDLAQLPLAVRSVPPRGEAPQLVGRPLQAAVRSALLGTAGLAAA